MTDTKLHWGRAEGLTLEALLGAAGLSDATALLYTPTRCLLARVERGQLIAHGAALDPSEPFEARIFNQDVEIRWLHTGGGVGAACWISESGQGLFGEARAHDVTFKLDQSYMLWGERADKDASKADGWTTLTSGRLGALHVPTALSGADRLQLTTVEYFGSDTFGNARLIDERLTGFAPYDSKER